MKPNDHKVVFSSEKTDWETPKDFFAQLNKKFHFTLDAAASDDNALCSKYYTEDDDGLRKSWQHEVVFVNPPYGSQITPLWIQKAYSESLKDNCDKVLLLAARTDNKAWSLYCTKAAEIYFIKGRLKFSNALHTAPFPSAIVVFNSKREGNRKVYWTNRTFDKFW